MATNNFNAQDLSGHVFRPIRSSRPHYNSAKVAPVTSYNEARVAPQATYQQVSMYDRWADDIKSVKRILMRRLHLMKDGCRIVLVKNL